MMSEQIAEILERIRGLEERLESELEKSRALYDLRGKLAEIREDVLAKQRALRTGILPFLGQTPLSHLVVAPVIYSMIIPIALLDLWVTLYQVICFRAYRIPRVDRAEYIAIDRHHLAYLNGIEKWNCVYCGYGNGVIAYAREIASRTEQYWCPIKHARRIKDPHNRYIQFLEYNDAEGFKARAEDLRKDVQMS